MKIFISHKFRGTNKVNLRNKLEKISEILEENGHQTFIYFRDKENWRVKTFPQGKVIKEAFKEIEKCDAILSFIDQKEISEGMLLEFGFAKALDKKKIWLISKKCSFPTLESISGRVIKFSSFENLTKRLNKIKLK